MDVFEKAHKMVSDLCQGRKDWIMSIPVDEERDPDVVIGKAIMAGMKAQSDADRRLELLKEINEHHLTFGECLFCTMLEIEEGYEHDPDCELAEAIDE